MGDRTTAAGHVDVSEKRRRPSQERAVQTVERLLDVAGELLAEVGIERISTNMICARARMTPPALYRYFKDKYAILEALGRRLLDRQNEVLFEWLAQNERHGVAGMSAALEDLFSRNAEVTGAQAGAVWILRALRAVPQLAHVRLESQRMVTDRFVEICVREYPQIDRERLWRRLRIATDFSFALEEMLHEETLIPAEVMIAEAAEILRHALADLIAGEDD